MRKQKMAILILVIVFSVLIFRAFCRSLYPLGTFYALFNPISIHHYEIDNEKCTRCGKCSKTCKMDVDVLKNPNSSECIRCGECIKSCPANAISGNWGAKKKEPNTIKTHSQKTSLTDIPFPIKMKAYCLLSFRTGNIDDLYHWQEKK